MARLKSASLYRLSRILAKRRWTSAGGTWARFVISRVLRVMRSELMMWLRSREGKYDCRILSRRSGGLIKDPYDMRGGRERRDSPAGCWSGQKPADADTRLSKYCF